MSVPVSSIDLYMVYISGLGSIDP